MNKKIAASTLVLAIITSSAFANTTAPAETIYYSCPSHITCSDNELSDCIVSQDGDPSVFSIRESYGQVVAANYIFEEAHIANLNKSTDAKEYACAYAAQQSGGTTILLHPRKTPLKPSPREEDSTSNWHIIPGLDAQCVAEPRYCLFKSWS